MVYLYLAALIAGLLLAVRLMFFGAERRRLHPDHTPLRRSEPAAVAFLVMFGVAGYLLTRHASLGAVMSAGAAILLGAGWAAVTARLAIVMARVTPAHDPDDPRYALQGQVATVAAGIPAGGEGTITFDAGAGPRTAPACAIDQNAIDEGVEVCIERIENGVVFVERWSLVEARL